MEHRRVIVRTSLAGLTWRGNHRSGGGALLVRLTLPIIGNRVSPNTGQAGARQGADYRPGAGRRKMRRAIERSGTSAITAAITPIILGGAIRGVEQRSFMAESAALALFASAIVDSDLYTDSRLNCFLSIVSRLCKTAGKSIRPTAEGRTLLPARCHHLL